MARDDSDDGDSTGADPPRPAADVTHPGGMRAERVFPTDGQSHLDPFVVFERLYIEPSQGFETHPHRGFEIVSYVLDGEMEHEDSMGHASTAAAGDAMRSRPGAAWNTPSCRGPTAVTASSCG